ncbi:MAG: hypothetical protein PVF45_03315, partial [Anaerolineae bacterium]
MSTRSLARLNLLVVISLLFSLIPTPRVAQAVPAPQPALERLSVERPAATAARALVWLPPVRPLGFALGAASATVQPQSLAAPVAGELAGAAAKTLAQPAAAPAAVKHPDPWPPADYVSFVWAGTEGSGAWYWDEGDGWEQRSGGALTTTAVVNDIAVNPFDHDVVLAAVGSNIYFTTTTQSWLTATWASEAPPTTTNWNALRWDTHTPNVAFATGGIGTGDTITPTWASSADNGRTWQWGLLFEGDSEFWEMYIDYGSDVWGAGTQWYIGAGLEGGITAPYYKRYWHSQDGGTSWDARLIDVEDWPSIEKWIAGRVDNPEVVFMAPYGHAGDPTPVARSYDGGGSWTEVGA